MATIKIRGRHDVIEIENDRAQTLKNRKFGLNGVVKAEPLELVDLGQWAGEYGRIVEINIPDEKKPTTYTEEQKKKEAAEEARFLRLDPAEKARQRTGLFKLQYSMRVGDMQAQPPAELLQKVIEALTTYFTEHPDELRASGSVFMPFLPERSDKSISRESLAKSKNMNPKP